MEFNYLPVVDLISSTNIGAGNTSQEGAGFIYEVV